MKIYVATKWEERSKAKEIMNLCQSYGHDITVDWTDESKEATEETLSFWSERDLQSVKDCELLIAYFPYPFLKYTGAFCELGAALVLKKKVWVIGHGADDCIFLHNKNIVRFEKMEELNERLRL